MKTLKLTLFALLACLSAGAVDAQSPPGVIGTDTLLRSETDLSTLPLLRNWTSNLQSSYDRSGGNGDMGNYLALNGNTATIADMDGPGAVVRLWSAGSTSHIKIYLDGSSTPVIDSAFGGILDGSGLPIAAALSYNGLFSYLPIPYAKHCRITLDNPGGLYYHVNYLSFAPGTKVRTFSWPLTAADQSALAAASDVWKNPGAVISPLPPGAQTKTVTLGAGKSASVGSEKGPGTISLLQLQAPDADDAGLRQLVLRGYFDGHTVPDIEAPVADFFGDAYGRKPFQSLLLSQDAAGTMQSTFPMPFGRTARFTVENGTQKPQRVLLTLGMKREPFTPGRVGYFHARWMQEITKRSLPHLWAQVRGQRGHFVGVVQTMAGSASLSYLEGDDQFRVDSQKWIASKVPSTVIGPWNGTGTEDAFNNAWYFGGGPNDLAMNGLLMKDSSGHVGRINAYRWFLNDAPVFQQSLDAQLEHGGQNDAPDNYYSSVTYWYADGQTQPWSAMPAASSIQPPLWPRVAQFPKMDLTNPVEGEALLATAKMTGGAVSDQYMGDFPSLWSGDNQLFWQGAKLGDTLTLTLPAHTAGTYDLVGYFTKAGDYGQVSFMLNGALLPGTFDGFHAGVINSGAVALGRVTLPAGVSTLVVTITGKNAGASGMLFGLDALVFNPPGLAAR